MQVKELEALLLSAQRPHEAFARIVAARDPAQTSQLEDAWLGAHSALTAKMDASEVSPLLCFLLQHCCETAVVHQVLRVPSVKSLHPGVAQCGEAVHVATLGIWRGAAGSYSSMCWPALCIAAQQGCSRASP